MRSFGTIRTRVERLAAACLPSLAPPIIIQEQFRYERCPACDAELEAHAALAVAAARADRARGVEPRVFEYDELTTCPRCDAPLP